VHIVKH